MYLIALEGEKKSAVQCPRSGCNRALWHLTELAVRLLSLRQQQSRFKWAHLWLPICTGVDCQEGMAGSQNMVVFLSQPHCYTEAQSQSLICSTLRSTMFKSSRLFKLCRCWCLTFTFGLRKNLLDTIVRKNSIFSSSDHGFFMRWWSVVMTTLC